MFTSRILSLATAAAFALLFGHLVDKTTGQPLVGVHIVVSGHGHSYSATTNKQGVFHLDVPNGHYRLRLSSADVPPQQQNLTVTGNHKSVTLQACSTTLDYACGSGPGGA